jgi:hypothetical protein
MVDLEKIDEKLESDNNWTRSLALSELDNAFDEGQNIDDIFPILPDLLFQIPRGVDEFTVKSIIVKYLNKKDDYEYTHKIYEKLEESFKKWKKNEDDKKEIEDKKLLIDDIIGLTSHVHI